LVGAVFAQNARFVSPDVFHLYYVITPLAAVVIGGTRALLGALLGCLVVVVLPLEMHVGPIANQVVSSLLLTAFIIFIPMGIAGMLAGKRKTALARAGHVDLSAAALPPMTADASHRTGPVLEVESLSVRYGALQAVLDFPLEIERGEIVGLIGPNGAGKSSLVNAISGLVRIQRGKVVMNGVDLTRAPSHARVGVGLARSFQNTAVIDSLTVRQSVLLAQGGGAYLGKTSGAAATQRADAVIAACGLGALGDVKVGSLTYMHRRLTAIAMTLITEPSLVMLDEATAGLTAQERQQIGAVIVKLARTRRMAFLVIEHDVEFVARIADRIVVMAEGKFLKTGVARDVLKDPAVVASYLGSSWNVARVS
jgi:branched-chain amino acid transport system permease protein